MNGIDPQDVKTFLVGHFADSFEAVGVVGADVPDSFDLMLEGIIDSLGVVEMVSAVEEHFKISLDLDDIDPEDLTRIGPFAKFVADFTSRPQ
jgi:acyl carrier protein